jgi:hypothetical protein
MRFVLIFLMGGLLALSGCEQKEEGGDTGAMMEEPAGETTMESITESTGEMMEDAGDAAGEAMDTMEETASDATEATGEMMDSAAETVKDTAEGATDAVEEGMDSAEETVDEATQ